MRIYLIGFMGCGKSTLGKPIARAMEYDFVDLDNYIEEQTGMSIPEIFAQKGEKIFRELENHYLCEISERDNIVISTGGGTPCFNGNMEIMNRSGTTIYLCQDVDILVSRLRNARVKRPLIDGKTDSELRTYIVETLGKREEYYRRAAITVANPSRDASRIINFLKIDK